MPDQTPEVCAECGLDELGNLEHQEWLPFDEKPRGHPFRPAEPPASETTAVNPGFCPSCLKPEDYCICVVNKSEEARLAERPEGEWRRVGEVGHGEVHWRIDSRDIDAVVSLSLERAISSASVAEYPADPIADREAAWADGYRAGREELERALEEAHEAIREWFAAEAANPASASLEDGSAWWSRRASARARLRALVSTESREEGGER